MANPRSKVTPTSYPVTALSRGRTNELLGKVLYQRMVITLTRYGKPVARVIPIEDGTVVTDPTANISPAAPKPPKPVK